MGDIYTCDDIVFGSVGDYLVLEFCVGKGLFLPYEHRKRFFTLGRDF